MAFDDATVRTMLAAQGYEAPDDDLTEIRVRLNDSLEHLLSCDAWAPFDEEPWPQWMVGRTDA